MGRLKEFYQCIGCDTFLLDDDLDIDVNDIKLEETDGTLEYVCPICGTKNELKKIEL